MARKKLIRQNTFPYHVYSRSNNKEWFQVPMPRMWEICYRSMLYALKKCPVNIHCFTLMKNHYHMLVTTPNSNLDEFMQYFNRNLSQLINKESGVINHKFANGYKWTIIDSESYLYNIYRYIYQNPMRANIAQSCLDYPYCSLQLSMAQKAQIKMEAHIDYYEHREWMEFRHGEELESTIRKSLNKKRFAIEKNSRIHICRVLSELPSE